MHDAICIFSSVEKNGFTVVLNLVPEGNGQDF